MNYQERLDCAVHQDPERCLESPMERELYKELRDFGIIPVMQYKIGNYFLDFAIPDIRIGIEYDGAQHMDEDAMGKDNSRTDVINGQGWNVYRVQRWVDDFVVSMRGVEPFHSKTLTGIAEYLAENIKNLRGDYE